MKQTPQTQQKVKLKELQLELPQTHIKVCCPACDTEAPADNINIQDKIAKCGECNAVFPFEAELANLKQLFHPEPKQTLLRPEGIDIFQ